MSKSSGWTLAARLGGAALALALAAACTDETDQFGGSGNFSSPHDMALLGSGCAVPSTSGPQAAAGPCLLFVLSADEDELNVLDLGRAPYRWVQAPNPLQPLAIPVLDSPSKLVADLRYFQVGDLPNDPSVEETGPYLYASNPALAEISVVGAVAEQLEDPATEVLEGTTEHLQELKRIQTSGPVATLTAWGAGSAGTESRLYYAVNSAGGGQVFRVSVPRFGLRAAPAPVPELLIDLPGEFVSALAVVPVMGTSTRENLAVATRSDQGRSGRTFVRDLVSLTEVTLNFPGPMRALQADPIPDNTGRYVWGLQDEAACEGGFQCRGLLAALVANGALASEIPVVHGSGTPVNFGLYPSASLLAPGRDSKFPVLGAVAYANGQVGFFDPAKFRSLDAIPGGPQVAGYGFLDSDGTLLENLPDHGISRTSILMQEGAIRDEQLALVYQGALPGLTGLALNPSDPVPTELPVDPALLAPCVLPPTALPKDAQACLRVQVGDVVVLQGGCTAELSVVSVGVDSLSLNAAPGGCSGATGYTVRAGTTRPLVVIGSASGFLGRTGLEDAADAFRIYQSFYYRPDGIDPAQATLNFVVPTLAPGILRDQRYLLTLASGVSPLFIAFNPASSQGNYRNPYPGGMGYLPRTTSLFVTLPAARQVLEVDTDLIAPNVVNFESIIEYQ
ncbi:MAG: hypothetical protein M3Y59_06955 [Myxococcota bacterium]|nr:hypothetical protein [Myxococcota bacterium]